MGTDQVCQFELGALQQLAAAGTVIAIGIEGFAEPAEQNPTTAHFHKFDRAMREGMKFSDLFPNICPAVFLTVTGSVCFADLHEPRLQSGWRLRNTFRSNLNYVRSGCIDRFFNCELEGHC